MFPRSNEVAATRSTQLFGLRGVERDTSLIVVARAVGATMGVDVASAVAAILCTVRGVDLRMMLSSASIRTYGGAGLDLTWRGVPEWRGTRR
jgi:hypothetical protein